MSSITVPARPGRVLQRAAVRLDRRAYSLVLRQGHILPTTVPWWQNRTLRFEYA
jgi:hypothetical protein